MTIVLTGATGYIGSRLLARLVADGHEVTALVRSDTAAARARDGGARAVVGDLYDADWVTGQFAAGDAVVHTAAAADGTSERMDRAVVTAAVRALGGTGRPYVHTSGIWVWGSNPAITEDAPFAPPALTAWRTAVERTVLDADLIATVVAPAIVHGYGAGIPAGVFGARDDRGRVPLVGSGEQRWTTVHVDDLAALYALVVESGAALGHLIGASGANPTVRELGEAAAGPAGVAPESEDASRERLGAAFADALLLDQATEAAKARALGWKPAGPTLTEELRSGSYTA
jgi:nucleoside-diphosphate-sugar epimerase